MRHTGKCGALCLLEHLLHHVLSVQGQPGLVGSIHNGLDCCGLCVSSHSTWLSGRSSFPSNSQGRQTHEQLSGHGHDWTRKTATQTKVHALLRNHLLQQQIGTQCRLTGNNDQILCLQRLHQAVLLPFLHRIVHYTILFGNCQEFPNIKHNCTDRKQIELKLVFS